MFRNGEVVDAEAKRFELGFGHMSSYQKEVGGYEDLAKVSYNVSINIHTMVY